MPLRSCSIYNVYESNKLTCSTFVVCFWVNSYTFVVELTIKTLEDDIISIILYYAVAYKFWSNGVSQSQYVLKAISNWGREV